MDSIGEPDFLELMAGPSNAMDTQENLGQEQDYFSSIAIPSGKPKGKGRKPKHSMIPSDTVSRQEFADVSEKRACGRGHWKHATVILSRPAKRPRLPSDS